MSSPCDPCDLDSLHRRVAAKLGSEAADKIGVREIVVDENALRLLPDRIRNDSAEASDVVLVWDDRPMSRGGVSLKPLVHEAVKEAGLPVRLVELTRNLHADDEAAGTVLDALDEGSMVVSVGSGNLTDTCKHACYLFAERGGLHLPLICFPTANSVNAYSSALAILIVNGVKRSLPSVLPDVILCDLPTLCSAPPAMQLAGLGDLLARCVAPGDWYLANVLGMDDTFREEIYELLDGLTRFVLDAAPEIGRQTLEGTRVLTKALILSGLLLTAARQTAPLSGWEHVMSHYLDLVALARGRPLGLHGAQVGVATIVSARAYELLLERARPSDYPALQVFPDPESIRRQIEAHFAPFDPDGTRRAELWSDCRDKLSHWKVHQDRWRSFCSDWEAGKIQTTLKRLVRPPRVVHHALSAAGAATTFAQLDPPVDADLALATIRHAHLVRQRFTLGDLLSSCALLSTIMPSESPCATRGSRPIRDRQHQKTAQNRGR